MATCSRCTAISTPTWPPASTRLARYGAGAGLRCSTGTPRRRATRSSTRTPGPRWPGSSPRCCPTTRPGSPRRGRSSSTGTSDGWHWRRPDPMAELDEARVVVGILGMPDNSATADMLQYLIRDAGLDVDFVVYWTPSARDQWKRLVRKVKAAGIGPALQRIYYALRSS